MAFEIVAPATADLSSGPSSGSAGPITVASPSPEPDRPARAKGIRSRSPAPAGPDKSQRISEATPIQTDEPDIPAGQPDPSFCGAENIQDYGDGSSIFSSPTTGSSFGPVPSLPGARSRAPALPPVAVSDDKPDFHKLVAESMTNTVLPLLATQNSEMSAYMSAQLQSNSKQMLAACTDICAKACTEANGELVQRITGIEGSLNSVLHDNKKLEQKLTI